MGRLPPPQTSILLPKESCWGYGKVQIHLEAQNPLIMAAWIFNKLPAALKVIEDDKVFVKKLKKVLHEKMFYDIHELLRCDFWLLQIDQYFKFSNCLYIIYFFTCSKLHKMYV